MLSSDREAHAMLSARFTRFWTILLFLIVLIPASFASADVVVLSTGERLMCDVISQTDDSITIDHPVLGRLELVASSVSQVIIEETSDPAQTDGQQQEEAAEEAPAEEEAPAPDVEDEPQWESNIDLGFAISEGNTENKSLTLSFKTERDTETERTRFDASYYFEEDDGETSDSKATAGIYHDWKLPDSRWLLFLTGRYDYDEFNSWESRVTAGGGVGYQFYRLDEFKLTGRAGLVGVREFESTRDDIRLEGLLGVELDWQIDERQSFALISTYFPDFEETGEFRWISEARWEMDIVAYDGMSLFLSVLHEHQSVVDPGDENNDLRVFGGLSIEF